MYKQILNLFQQINNLFQQINNAIQNLICIVYYNRRCQLTTINNVMDSWCKFLHHDNVELEGLESGSGFSQTIVAILL